MTREQFIAKCLKRSGGTEEHLLEYHEITECRCGKKKCPGWQAEYKLRNRRRAAPKPRRPSTAATSHGYVYFARLGNLIKIGFSKNPQQRADHLSAELLGACDGTREMEAELHVEFADVRSHREWFQPTPELLARIEALCK